MEAVLRRESLKRRQAWLASVLNSTLRHPDNARDEHLVELWLMDLTAFRQTLACSSHFSPALCPRLTQPMTIQQLS